jgi:hypothetical protein
VADVVELEVDDPEEPETLATLPEFVIEPDINGLRPDCVMQSLFAPRPKHGRVNSKD